MSGHSSPECRPLLLLQLFRAGVRPQPVGIGLLILSEGSRQTSYVEILREVRPRCPKLFESLVLEEDWDRLLADGASVDEAGRMDLDLETFGIGQLVRDVQAIVQPLVEKNANALVVSCPGDLGAMHADQTKVRQTLFNLLSNAAKFTDHGTIALIVAREPEDRITFSVSDTGIGMTEAQLGRLFEAFSQAEASTRSRYGGTGLGLAISRHFCRIMGGDLTVESVYGQRSTFTVRLPGLVSAPALPSAQGGTPAGAA